MTLRKIPVLFQIKNSLGPLESEVIRIIWMKDKTTVREVVNALKENCSFAYTTIMTVMDNLHKKGFVKRIKIKKTYHYEPLASESLLIRSSVVKTFQSLTADYGKFTVLSSLIMPKLNLPTTYYNTPVIAGFLVSLVLGLFTLSLWDLLQSLTFFGSIDYLKLAFLEPKIIFDHTNLLLEAFLESLPIISLLTNLILFIFVVFIIKKVIKLLDFKFPFFIRMGGLT